MAAVAIPGLVILGCTVRALACPVFVEVLAGATVPLVLSLRAVLAGATVPLVLPVPTVLAGATVPLVLLVRAVLAEA